MAPTPISSSCTLLRRQTFRSSTEWRPQRRGTATIERVGWWRRYVELIEEGLHALSRELGRAPGGAAKDVLRWGRELKALELIGEKGETGDVPNDRRLRLVSGLGLYLIRRPVGVEA